MIKIILMKILIILICLIYYYFKIIEQILNEKIQRWELNNNISQSAVVNTQLNADVKSDNKIGVSVNLGGIGINMNNWDGN